MAQTLKDENGEGTVVIVNDGEESQLRGEEKRAFDKLLPLASKKVISKKGLAKAVSPKTWKHFFQVKPASEAEADDKLDLTTRKVIKLYQCTDEEGTLRIREVKGGPLEQSDLLSKDSFIIDNGAFGIWVWVGKRASSTERTEAMRNAQGFIKKKGKWKKEIKKSQQCCFRSGISILVSWNFISWGKHIFKKKKMKLEGNTDDWCPFLNMLATLGIIIL